ncbi:hypothetical protein GO755_27895 [Spirosoma sp. HMF4905]|uniref:Plasmid mobilization relaxosome protein MobC n=1 Tax=Spirosoma arboris TaxID=2682092 RepID=A0A7K1SJ98_9BACT|nr:hypothetical protein [Spirosoma arboris]MVM33891.1 hypothetical protein [Spirosoma arboris]
METKINKGGAPKKQSSESKTRAVKVLFNEQEFIRLMDRKATTKSADLSKFIRTICLDKPMRMKPQHSTYQESALSLLREMRADLLRIGVSINQSRKRINSTTDYQNLQREVEKMVQRVNGFDSEFGRLIVLLSQEDPFK